MDSIRFAVAGVGNVASALVQGTVRDSELQGLSPEIWPVLGFDVHKDKTGRCLSEAIRVSPNCASWLGEELSSVDATVLRGPLLDGLCPELREVVPIDDAEEPIDIASSLRDVGAEVLVILLPTGAQRAAETYARAAIEAKCAIVNGMPAHVAKHSEIARQACDRSIPIVGDDVKSQVGATILHRALMEVFRTRGAHVHQTIQLDWGGDTDFMNLVRGGRYDEGKRTSKTEAVVWNHPDTKAHISASDYIPFLGNVKEAYTRLEGTIFAGAKVRIDMFLCVEDAYNSAGVLTQAIRCAGLARRSGLGGVLDGPSAWFCKHPPAQMSDAEALATYSAFMESISANVRP